MLLFNLEIIGLFN